MVSSLTCSSSPAATRSAFRASHTQSVPWWYGALLLFVWAVFSSGTIFLNKHLYTSGGFPYPLASTAVGQLTTAAGGYVLTLLGLFPTKPLPHRAQVVTKLVPAALSTSGTLFAGNYAYLTLSVAFMQVRPCLFADHDVFCSPQFRCGKQDANHPSAALHM